MKVIYAALFGIILFALAAPFVPRLSSFIVVGNMMLLTIPILMMVKTLNLTKEVPKTSQQTQKRT